MRLFCFPFAGGGAPAYRLWPQHLPDDVEVISLHPAGRAHRLREPPLTSIDAMVAAAVDALEPWMDRPFALFGHSLGAVVAGETARVLQARGRAPAHVFVSARSPERKGKAQIHTLPDPEFIEAMNRRYQGIPAEILREPEILELLLPPLRADIMALETFYPDPDRPKIVSPVTVYGGSLDPQVSFENLEAWEAETTAGCRIRVFDGDHFYIDPQRTALLADISATLAPLREAAHRDGPAQ